MRRSTAIALLGFVLSSCGGKPSPVVNRDREFERTYSGVTLIGHSTRDGREGLSGEERYRIDKVTKLAGDTWLFQSHMKYGAVDLPIPVPLTIHWAGDTPVITLTDLSIPGAGTYTARVLLYRDRYAGTWSGKKGGGQMFGRIERSK